MLSIRDVCAIVMNYVVILVLYVIELHHFSESFTRIRSTRFELMLQGVPQLSGKEGHPPLRNMMLLTK